MRNKKIRTLVLFWISFLLCVSGWIAIFAAQAMVPTYSNGTSEKERVVYNYTRRLLYEFAMDYADYGSLSEKNELLYSSENTNLALRFIVNSGEVFSNVPENKMLHETFYNWGDEIGLYEDDTKFTLEYELKNTNVADDIQRQFNLIDGIITYREALYVTVGISTLLFIISFVVSLKYIGRKKDGTYSITIIDRIPLEVLILLVLSLFSLSTYDETWFLIFFITTAIALRSCAVRINAGVFFKFTCVTYLTEIYEYSKHNQAGLGFVGLGGLVASLFLVMVSENLGALFIFVFWPCYFIIARAWIHHDKDVGVIQKMTMEIKGGYYTTPPVSLKSKKLNTISRNLSEIQSGLKGAVDQQLKSEKTKSELITNVSHDLKTPLTSIVNYVDLLKHESLIQTQMEYLEVVDKQVSRLKKLTDDLFEAAKINTQDVEVIKEPINLKVFWEQSIAEYEVQIEEKKLQLITNLDAVDVNVLADGRYFWRVIDNVLRNLTLYALDNSRVYIDGSLTDNVACLSIKNISKDALNITEDELMERFVRGDSSRNTEGSGLGLSIARSIVTLLNGDFNIKIDGDLFKVEICLPLAIEPNNL